MDFFSQSVILFLVATASYSVTPADSENPGGDLRQQNIRLSATITEINITKNRVQSSNLIRFVEDSKQFSNKGGSKIKKTYTLNMTLTDNAEIRRVSGSSQFHSFQVNAIWTFDPEISIGNRANFMIFLTDAYNFTTKYHKIVNPIYQATHTYPLTQSKDVIIESCQACDVVATIQQMIDQRFDYVALVNIKGNLKENERLEAEEVRKYLRNNFVYAGNTDNFTVRASFIGSLTMSYYMKPTIEIKCDAIPKCDSNEATPTSSLSLILPGYIAEDIYKNNRAKFQDPSGPFELLDVQVKHECRNIVYWPGIEKTNIQSDICIYHYSSSNCTGNGKIVNLTRSINVDRRGLAHHESIRPCNVNEVFSTKSHRLTLQIVEFTVGESRNNPSSSAETLNVGEPMEYSNKENVKIYQEFTARWVVTESAEMERNIKNSQIVKMHFAKDAKINFSETNATGIIREIIHEAYTLERLSTDAIVISNKIKSSRNHTVELKRGINVFPCMTKKVSTTLKFRKNVRFQYTTRAHVFGYNYIDNLLNAKEIGETLGDTFAISQDVDDETVEVQFTGSLVASYVETAEIAETGEEEIGNCRNDCDDFEGLYQAQAGICGECHEQCKSCKGPALEECKECKHVKNNGICTDACPKDKENKVGVCIEVRGILPTETGNEGSGSNNDIYIGLGIGLALAVIIATIVIAYIKRRRGENAVKDKRSEEAEKVSTTENEVDRLLNHNPPDAEINNASQPGSHAIDTHTDYQAACNSSDVSASQLKSIKREIVALEKAVESYVGPHFTKEYDDLQGKCYTLQQEVDKLYFPLEYQEDLRIEKKILFLKTELLVKLLGKKVHGYGKVCKFCDA